MYFTPLYRKDNLLPSTHFKNNLFTMGNLNFLSIKDLYESKDDSDKHA